MFYKLHFILFLIEHSEVNICMYLYVHFFKSAMRRENLRKSHLILIFHLRKEYSVFLRKSVLPNYKVILLQCVVCVCCQAR